MEFDKASHVFPLDSVKKTASDEAVAKALWKWADGIVNSRIVVLRDEDFKQVLPGKTWIINLLRFISYHSYSTTKCYLL